MYEIKNGRLLSEDDLIAELTDALSNMDSNGLAALYQQIDGRQCQYFCEGVTEKDVFLVTEDEEDTAEDKA